MKLQLLKTLIKALFPAHCLGLEWTLYPDNMTFVESCIFIGTLRLKYLKAIHVALMMNAITMEYAKALMTFGPNLRHPFAPKKANSIITLRLGSLLWSQG